MLVPLHGIASRHDLPLPFSFVVIGAVLALTISFVILIFAWRAPRFDRVGGRPMPRLTAIVDYPVTRLVARVVVLAAYVWALLALLAGQDLLTNPAFGFVYVWMWVGLVPISLLLGQFWRATNPLRTIHRGLCALARVDPGQGLVALSAKVGVWPAAAGIFGFAWLELVQPDRTTLAVLRLWALAWLVILVLGAIVFGQRWIGAADPFEAYASTLAQMSIWRRVGDQMRLVNPLAGLNAWHAPPGATAVVAALLGSTAFDSFANTSWWIGVVQSSSVPTVMWGTGGLLAMIIIVFVSFSLAAAWMGRYGGRPAAAYPRLMVGSLLPIVLGYVVAHYATLLIVEGQRTAINFSDPLGRGWNVFGSAEMGVNSAIFNYPTAIALVQLAAIVGGHVLGIVCAHEKAVTLLPPDRALRGQWPLLLVMVGYTCAGLVLLFSP
ncbi:MAG: conserved rane protein of unknown function [Propionibacteriaceae bacterium]|jgi:hypothetical protein|nr:conserved rane protein of unknown function [Propionibacteriaceae bacterium]